jgi:hypothetical protein
MTSDARAVRVDTGFGIVWFIGWLFTLGFLKLGFWVGVLALFTELSLAYLQRLPYEAVKIDPARKVVTVLNHLTGETREEDYDKLILSPGAEPFVPPIEGAKSDKVFTLRNIPDTYRIKEYVDQKKPRTAIVAGGNHGTDGAVPALTDQPGILAPGSHLLGQVFGHRQPVVELGILERIG